MHTWKILKIYDYSRTKTAAHILFLIQILCYYFAHENRNYPFCSTCLFFKIYDFGYQTLFSGI